MDRDRDRRSGPDPGLTPKPRRRLRLPRTLQATRAGWCFVVIVFGVGFAALNTGNNLLYLVLSLLLAFLVLSGLLSESSLRGLRVERRLPRELFAGVPNRITLRLRNDQGRTPSFAVSVEDRILGRDGVEAAGRAFALRIGARAAVDRSYDFEPPRRGDLHFVGCRLSTRFPFGLFVKSVDLDLESIALVYPELAPVIEASPTSRDLDSGERRHRISRDGDELSNVREYGAGDSIRRVNWRRSLRTGRLIVGDREGESSARIEVLLPLTPELAEAEIESRVTRAASEVVAHLANGDEVGLRTNRSRFDPRTGFAHRTTLLSFLARVDADESLAGPPRQPEAAT